MSAIRLGRRCWASIKGRIESITGGISAANVAAGRSLVAGMTCGVSVVPGEGMSVARRDPGLFPHLKTYFREIR